MPPKPTISGELEKCLQESAANPPTSGSGARICHCCVMMCKDGRWKILNENSYEQQETQIKNHSKI
jgi:hypothetical protein